MANKTQRSERRSDALSKERIVEAAIKMLDIKGESALTFRALMAQLATGSGAIYWHVSDKNDLLAACTDFILEQVMTDIQGQVEPVEAIRALALGIFEALDKHPWIGTQLLSETGQRAMLQLYEKVDSQLLSFTPLPIKSQTSCRNMMTANSF